MTVDLVPVSEASTFDLVPRAWQLAEKISRTEFVPPGLRGKPDAIMACVLAGAELDIQPMTALRHIHVIDGRPTLSAELMRAVVIAHGHEVWVEEATASRATVCGQRAGSAHTQRVTWIMDDARKAGLDGKQNWRKYPRAMLLARATSELLRMMAPDVLAGFSYAREEVEDGFDFDEITTEATAPAEAPDPARVRSLTKRAGHASKPPAEQPSAPTLPLEEGAPPLPDDDEVVEGEIVEEPAEVDDATSKRAQRIAMRARELGLDHHRVIATFTGDVSMSAKDLSDEQADLVLDALRRLRLGELVLVDDEEGRPTLATPAHIEPAQPEPDDPDLGDVTDWTADQWRAWLQRMGVKVGEVMREAKRAAAEIGEPEPVALRDFQGSPLAVLVASWVEDTRANA